MFDRLTCSTLSSTFPPSSRTHGRHDTPVTIPSLATSTSFSSPSPPSFSSPSPWVPSSPLLSPCRINCKSKQQWCGSGCPLNGKVPQCAFTFAQSLKYIEHLIQNLTRNPVSLYCHRCLHHVLSQLPSRTSSGLRNAVMPSEKGPGDISGRTGSLLFRSTRPWHCVRCIRWGRAGGSTGPTGVRRPDHWQQDHKHAPVILTSQQRVWVPSQAGQESCSGRAHSEPQAPTA